MLSSILLEEDTISEPSLELLARVRFGKGICTVHKDLLDEVSVSYAVRISPEKIEPKNFRLHSFVQVFDAYEDPGEVELVGVAEDRKTRWLGRKRSLAESGTWTYMPQIF